MISPFQILYLFNKDIIDKHLNTMKKSKIREALSKLIAETFERVTTDKGILALDGALEDLEVGMGVMKVDEDGNEVAVEDGDYKLEDGRILRIEGGKIVEIIDPVEETPAEEPEEAPAEEEVEVEAEEAPAEEPEVENPTNDGEESETEAVVKLREEVNELYELVRKLEDRIAELEKKPGAEPAEEEFKKTKETKLNTRDAHRNFLAELNKAN